MDEILRKLSLLSYELVGFFSPGASALVGTVAASFMMLTCFGSADQLRSMHTAIEILKVYGWITVFCALIAAYVAATFVRQLATRGFWFLQRYKKDDDSFKSANVPSPMGAANPASSDRDSERRPINRLFTDAFFVLVLARTSKRSTGPTPQLRAAFDSVSKELAKRAGYEIDTKLAWKQFYPLARTVVRLGGHDSLIQSFQNKYTLARAMAYVIALINVSVALMGCYLWLTTGDIQPLIAVAASFVVAFFSVRALLFTYDDYWHQWPDAVVGEAMVELKVPPSATKK